MTPAPRSPSAKDLVPEGLPDHLEIGAPLDHFAGDEASSALLELGRRTMSELHRTTRSNNPMEHSRTFHDLALPRSGRKPNPGELLVPDLAFPKLSAASYVHADAVDLLQPPWLASSVSLTSALTASSSSTCATSPENAVPSRFPIPDLLAPPQRPGLPC